MGVKTIVRLRIKCRREYRVIFPSHDYLKVQLTTAVGASHDYHVAENFIRKVISFADSFCKVSRYINDAAQTGKHAAGPKHTCSRMPAAAAGR